MKLTTDRYKASRGLFATAELLVSTLIDIPTGKKNLLNTVSSSNVKINIKHAKRSCFGFITVSTLNFTLSAVGD